MDKGFLKAFLFKYTIVTYHFKIASFVFGMLYTKLLITHNVSKKGFNYVLLM